MRRVMGMPLGAVRVMGGLLVMPTLVVLGGLAVMTGGVLVVLGSLVVVVGTLMLGGHGDVLWFCFPARRPDGAQGAIRNNRRLRIAEPASSRLCDLAGRATSGRAGAGIHRKRRSATAPIIDAIDNDYR